MDCIENEKIVGKGDTDGPLPSNDGGDTDSKAIS
jgi:hypothetical protein